MQAPRSARAVTIFDNGVILGTGAERNEKARDFAGHPVVCFGNGADGAFTFSGKLRPQEEKKRPRKRSKYEATKVKITTQPPRFPPRRRRRLGFRAFRFCAAKNRRRNNIWVREANSQRQAPCPLTTKFFGEIKKKKKERKEESHQNGLSVVPIPLLNGQ